MSDKNVDLILSLQENIFPFLFDQNLNQRHPSLLPPTLWPINITIFSPLKFHLCLRDQSARAQTPAIGFDLLSAIAKFEGGSNAAAAAAAAAAMRQGQQVSSNEAAAMSQEQ